MSSNPCTAPAKASPSAQLYNCLNKEFHKHRNETLLTTTIIHLCNKMHKQPLALSVILSSSQRPRDTLLSLAICIIKKQESPPSSSLQIQIMDCVENLPPLVQTNAKPCVRPAFAGTRLILIQSSKCSRDPRAARCHTLHQG